MTEVRKMVCLDYNVNFKEWIVSFELGQEGKMYRFKSFAEAHSKMNECIEKIND